MPVPSVETTTSARTDDPKPTAKKVKTSPSAPSSAAPPPLPPKPVGPAGAPAGNSVYDERR
jgi:hypothetical protein